MELNVDANSVLLKMKERLAEEILRSTLLEVRVESLLLELSSHKKDASNHFEELDD